MHLHIYFVTLITLSIISTCSSFPYIYTRIKRYSLNCDMLKSLSPLIMVALKPHVSYLTSTMSITVLIWAVDLDLNGWAVTKINFYDLVARKGYPLTKKKFIYNCTSLWCYDIGNGSGMRSILSDFGWYLVILTCNRGVAGP